MGKVQDRSPGGLVDTAALHPDKAVFHHVDTSYTMTTTDFVEGLHHAERIEFLTVHSHAISLNEIKGHDLGLVRGGLRARRKFEHARILGSKGIEPRILQDTALVADVEQVSVHRVGLLGARLHRDLVSAAILDHLGPAGEVIAEALLAPGSDDLKIRREGGGGQLEANLIIPLPRGPVGDCVGTLG